MGIENVTSQCGNDVGPLVETVQRLVESLDIIEENIEASVHLSDCSNISPILQGVLHGASCDSAIDGLAWTFLSMLSITALGMMTLTLRAALYNATIRVSSSSSSSGGRRGDKRKNAKEKEWREYQEFMSRYYEDALYWKYHPSPESSKKKKKKDDGGIGTVPSFETELTGKPSEDEVSLCSYGSPRVLMNRHDNNIINNIINEEFDDEDYTHDNNYSNDIGGIFRTPLKSMSIKSVSIKSVSKMLVNEKAERMKDWIDVIDEELVPLTPPPSMAPPMAPKKPMQNLQRTTQRKLLC
mmetsp:Transcript_19755/g.28554  ORF Transcript_19755/g.28554 Transcript_19755/m.28554 type:complete len:297 (+) Transcript_19755:248-1138(+)